MEHESDGDIYCNWHAQYSNRKIGTVTGGLENKRDEWRPSKLQHC